MSRRVPGPRLLIGTLGLAQIVSWGSIYYGFSLFVLPMQASFGWSLTLMNGALTLGLLVAGVCAYPVGAYIDRHGGRAVMTLASLAATGAFLCWSRIETPAALYAVWAGFGVCMAGALYEPLFVVLTYHFRADARRAITALTLVAGFASTVFVPLIEILLRLLHWRDVLLVLAALNFVVCVPLHATVLPDRADSPPPNTAQARRGSTRALLGRHLRNPVFWGLALWFTAYAGTASGLMFQLVPYLKSRNVDAGTLLLAVALVGPAQVGGRLLLMLRHQHGELGRVGALTTALTPLAVLILIQAPPTTAWLVVFAMTFGIANGISTILRGVVPSEWLGRDDFGRTMGLLAAPMMIVAALAPLGAAAIWSASGDAQAMQWAVFAFSLTGAAGYWLAVVARRNAPPHPG